MSNVIIIQGYQLHIHEGEPMIQDLDLAKRLEYKEPRMIRKLIKRLIENGVIKQESVCATVSQTPGGGRPSTIYHLNEKAALKVITKSETEKADQITDEMIDVFISYRNGNLRPTNSIDLDDPEFVANLIAQSAQKVQTLQKEKLQLEHKIEEDAPKVNFYDAFANEDGLFGIQNAARILKQGPNLFARMLKEKGYLFYQGTALVPKVNYIHQGIFELRTTIIDDKARCRTWITPKGLQYFAKKLSIDLEGDAA